MERSRVLSAVLAFAALAACSTSFEAQTAFDGKAPSPSHVLKADQRPMPFPPGSETAGPAAVLAFRAYDQMSRQDRDLAVDAESAIGEKAGFAGLEFNEGKWSYQQIVCPALPNHLLLQFTRNNGKGDVSVFSASIPRGGDGKVRIVPIVRRGYSLFSPAPINALTISAFNRIRAEEHSDQTPAWLEIGLCYAALAGAHPPIASAEQTEAKSLPTAPPGMLEIPMHGGAVISFSDVSAMPRPTLWTMTFDGNGRLFKATHSVAATSQEKAKLRTPVEVQGKPVKSTDPEAKATLIK